MRRRKHVEALIAKAAQDEFVFDRLLRDTRAPIEVFGFHAQQATEKLLKAALVAACADSRRSHRVEELLDSMRARDLLIPEEFDILRHLITVCRRVSLRSDPRGTGNADRHGVHQDRDSETSRMGRIYDRHSPSHPGWSGWRHGVLSGGGNRMALTERVGHDASPS